MMSKRRGEKRSRRRSPSSFVVSHRRRATGTGYEGLLLLCHTTEGLSIYTDALRAP